MRQFRLGVGARLFMAVMAVAASAGVALWLGAMALADFGRATNTIVEDRLPALIDATQVSVDVQAIVAEAPAVLAVNTQFELEAVQFRITDRLAALRLRLAKLDGAASSGQDLARLQRLAQAIQDALRTLGDQRSRRLALIVQRERLYTQSVAIRDAVTLAAASEIPGLDLRTSLWAETASSATTLLFSGLSASRLVDLQPQIEAFRKALSVLDTADAAMGRSSPERQIAFQLLDSLGTGAESVFVVRERELLVEAQQSVLMRRIAALSDAFVASAEALSNQVRTDTSTATQSVVDTIGWYEQLFVVISIIGFLVALATLLYVNFGLVRRLLAVSHAMRRYAEGAPTPIADHHRDEVGDIARAYGHMVGVIAERESALGQAKTEAEAALVELRDTQASLIQAEKMASLGALVAGVAHEINTPVGVGTTAASALAEETKEFRSLVDAGQLRKSAITRFLDKAEECAHLILANLDRAAHLIQSFKRVAVDQSSESQRRFDLAVYVGEVVTALKPELKRQPIEVALAVPPGIILETLPGALAQVLTNLVMNAAIHAFPDGRAGRIDINARRLGDDVELTVADTGAGIPQANLPKIFEPFFTTRRSDGGSGLGLHIVFNLVTHSLGGRIRVESVEGRGTRFVVIIPTRLGDQVVAAAA
jgi:signal transduction histidine kinase